jgi:hypothetical protein
MVYDLRSVQNERVADGMRTERKPEDAVKQYTMTVSSKYKDELVRVDRCLVTKDTENEIAIQEVVATPLHEEQFWASTQYSTVAVKRAVQDKLKLPSLKSADTESQPLQELVSVSLTHFIVRVRDFAMTLLTPSKLSHASPQA